MATPTELHNLLRSTTSPAQQSGFIGAMAVDHTDVEWILENFGEHGIVWLGLLGRGDLSQDWIERASRIPDPRVMGRIITHRFTTRQTVEWIADFAQDLAVETRASTEVDSAAGEMSAEQQQHAAKHLEALEEAVAYANRVLKRLDGDVTRS